MIGPPSDVAPQRLFRLLLQTPRPTLPVEVWIVGLPPARLHVQALLPSEEADALDGDDASTPWRLVAAVLRDARGPVFESAAQITGMLSTPEADRLQRDVLGALYRIAPSHAWSDLDAWHRALAEGAEHPSNMGITGRLGSAFDFAVGWGGMARVHRPERYFGLTPADLTEGHWMVAAAAWKAVEKWRK